MGGQHPVIILGMHRSGTSMLSRWLDSWGLFMGAVRDQNHESAFFQRINEWLFFQANASWDCPENMLYIDDSLGKLLEEGVRYLLSGERRLQYIGKYHAGKYRDISELDFSWGWKDPRNIFTIDIWKKIFPAARIIHICRNPVDVAESVRVREQKRFAEIENTIRSSGVDRIVNQGLKFRTTTRCLDIREGIRLWEAYEHRAERALEQFKGQALSVRYEDLLENPVERAREIADFAGLSPGESEIRSTVSGLVAERRYAFTASGELRAVYEKVRSDRLVSKLGYGDLELR